MDDYSSTTYFCTGNGRNIFRYEITLTISFSTNKLNYNKMVEIYTDGGCSVHSGKVGAWAFVVVKEDEAIEESYGVVNDTTNGFMEVLGMLNALEYSLKNFDQETEIVIRCDSQYVVNAYNDWSHKWAKNRWRKANNKPIEHETVWRIMHTLRAPNIKVEWVRGHNGNKWNEYVDKLTHNRE